MGSIWNLTLQGVWKDVKSFLDIESFRNSDSWTGQGLALQPLVSGNTCTRWSMFLIPCQAGQLGPHCFVQDMLYLSIPHKTTPNRTCVSNKRSVLIIKSRKTSYLPDNKCNRIHQIYLFFVDKRRCLISSSLSFAPVQHGAGRTRSGYDFACFILTSQYPNVWPRFSGLDMAVYQPWQCQHEALLLTNGMWPSLTNQICPPVGKHYCSRKASRSASCMSNQNLPISNKVKTEATPGQVLVCESLCFRYLFLWRLALQQDKEVLHEPQ